MPNENTSGLIIIAPHKKKSKDVKEKHLSIVKKYYLPLKTIMEEMEGEKYFKSIYAIAHCQVTKKNPLRFFVINKSNELMKEMDIDDLIINPVILNHTKQICYKEEGCLSFPGYPNVQVERWNKIEVKFLTANLEENKLYSHTLNLSGKLAEIFQHEIDHFNAIYIYKI